MFCHSFYGRTRTREEKLLHFELEEQGLEVPRLVGDRVLAAVRVGFLQGLLDQGLHVPTVNLAVFQELDALLRRERGR